MSNEIISPTSNHGAGAIIGGVSSVDEVSQINVRIDPTTKRVLTSASIAGDLPLPTGAATSAKQDAQTTLLQGIAGFTITGYDYIALTYVAAGNGAGEIETAIFKTGGSGGSTIATLTLTYNASNEVATVTKT